MWKVYTQDSFCFPGCMPEGYGPDSNGDTFDTRDEAIESALCMLYPIFDAEPGLWGNRKRAVAAELAKSGEVSISLPYRDEETDEVSTQGYRFISFAVAND